jgi:hypothetical protein
MGSLLWLESSGSALMGPGHGVAPSAPVKGGFGRGDRVAGAGQPTPAPGEDRARVVGEIRMTHLAAESQVFQEMVFDRWLAEGESEDLTPDPADPAYNRYLAQLDDLRTM